AHRFSRFFFFFSLRPPPTFPLFPYTTLFRSASVQYGLAFAGGDAGAVIVHLQKITACAAFDAQRHCRTRPFAGVVQQVAEQFQRSEEHTSELQSRENLVCRLLLEKKNSPTTA